MAEIVIAVTKPYIDGAEILDKPKVLEQYKENLENASPEAILVKMADRVHNMRTLTGAPAEKQLIQIVETEEVYIPLFTRKVLPSFPSEGKHMITNIQNNITSLRASHTSM